MKKIYLPSIIAVALATGILSGIFFAKLTNKNSASQPVILGNGDKISDVLNIIDNKYVDIISSDSLTESVIPEIIAQLDPHSSYIPARDLQMVNEELSGSFYGIGVQFNLQNDTIYVVNVVSGGPSEKVGILAGDKIIFVNDSLLIGKKITNEKVLTTLRGDKNTKVKLGIIRKENLTPLSFTVTRGEVSVKSVDVAYMIANKVGYISINKFGETTYKEFLAGMAKLRHQGANSLIIDLRGNAGGYLVAATNMLNEFLKQGDMIVYMEGAHQKRVDSFANGIGSFKDMKLAVLIDEFSGSASEIFAGAIQDNDRGTIIGRRSFGKGLVQQQIELGDGSALRITIARYYTPSGRSIQKPYSRGDSQNYDMDILNRYRHGEFYSEDSIHQNEKMEFKTKSGRKVYGGGGIMPDIFIANDTTELSKYYSDLVNKGLIYKFALNYTENHRNELNKIKDWQKMQTFLEEKNFFTAIENYGERHSVFGKATEKLKSKKLIEKQTIAYIIRNVLDENGFFPYYNQTDKCVQKAVAELRK